MIQKVSKFENQLRRINLMVTELHREDLQIFCLFALQCTLAVEFPIPEVRIDNESLTGLISALAG